MAGMLTGLDGALAAATDPPVPAGRDPGGYPVAIVGAGIDYTRDTISQRLARDGEGEIIGYDFIDDDRRPYATGAETDASEILLGEGQAATLVVVRADVLQAQLLARAIGYAAQSPARIIAVFGPAGDARVEAVLAAAAQKFPEHLFLASIDADQPPATTVNRERAPNLLIVTNAGADAVPSPPARDEIARADIAIDVSDLRQRPTSVTSGQIALARTAALAARLMAVDTLATAADLKNRIVALAEPLPDAKKFVAQRGWIPQPRRHFWLE